MNRDGNVLMPPRSSEPFFGKLNTLNGIVSVFFNPRFFTLRKNRQNGFPRRRLISVFSFDYVAMMETGSLQALWPVLPPSAQNWIV